MQLTGIEFLSPRGQQADVNRQEGEMEGLTQRTGEVFHQAVATPSPTLSDGRPHGMQALSAEMIYHILRFLSLAERLAVRRVDRRFNNLICTPSVLRRYLAGGNPLTVKQLMFVLKKLGTSGTEHIQSLNLSNLLDKDHFRDKHMQVISTCCSNLRSLSISNCRKITDQSLVDFFATNRETLEELNLRCCVITDIGLAALVQSNTPKLRSLNLKDCSSITHNSLVALGEKGYPLEELNLAYCLALKNEAVIDFAKRARPTLTKLDLSTLTLNAYLSDQALVAMACACSNLRVLNIRYQTNITDEGLLGVLQQCSRLEDLDCIDINRGLPLTKSLIMLAERKRKLQTLRLWNPSRDRQPLFQFLSTPQPYLLNLHLELPLEGEEELQAIATNCSQLRKLNLRLTRITEVGARAIASLRELRGLWLSGRCDAVALQALLSEDHKLLDFQLLASYPSALNPLACQTLRIDASCSKGCHIDTVELTSLFFVGLDRLLGTLSHNQPLEQLRVDKMHKNVFQTNLATYNCHDLAKLIRQMNPKSLDLRALILESTGQVAQACQNIERLSLRDMDGECSGNLPSFIRTLSSLRTLYIDTSFSRHGRYSLQRMHRNFKSPIQELILTSPSPGTYGQTAPPLDGLCDLARMSPDLRVLRLTRSTVGNSALPLFRDMCPKLERIEAINSPDIFMPDPSFFQGRENLKVYIKKP